MADQRQPSPEEETKRLYGEAEARTARAFENLVSRDSFGELLARLTENTVALTKIGTDMLDLMLRNLRVAGRQDVTRLARQLGRTEDKLELVLQEVERLHDRADADAAANGRAANAANATERRARATGQRRSGGSS